MTRMFLDDERFPPGDGEGWVIVRTFDEATDECWRNGCPLFISFDHDLGEGLTGFDFAKWLVEQDLDVDGSFLPPDFSYTIHSQNPIGAANIDGILKSYLKQRTGHEPS